jgi:bifunctional DNase/RNase
MTRWVPMVVDGVRCCDCAGRHPILALSEPDGFRWLNVSVTGNEADHLASEIAGHRTRASVIYSLLDELVSALDWHLSAVRLVGTERQEMLGLVELGRGDERAGIRAHPSDAVVLACRCAVTIDVPLELAQVGDRQLAQPWLECDDADTVAIFRRQLDAATPDDFGR